MIDTIMQFLFNDDWGQFILGGFATTGFIAHAVAITPTKKDDQAVGTIRTVLNLFGGNYANAKNKDAK